MKKQWLVLVLLLSVMSVCAYAANLGTYAFPQKGQTPEQQKTDENACAQWASDQTNLNPAVLEYQQEEANKMQQEASATQQANEPGVGRRIGKTALRGAALGAINKSMDDGAGKGAAMGAAVGLAKAKDAKQSQAVEGTVKGANAKLEKVQTDVQKYIRAYSACMEGKGYSIK